MSSISAFSSLPTRGGGSFDINGAGFGSLAVYGVSNGAIVVTYGPASSPTRYTATGCRVTVADVTISCYSAPGVGKDFTFIINQDLRVLGTISTVGTTSYAAPRLFSITGPGALSPTTGGSQVVITGDNFGPADAITNAQIVATDVLGFLQGIANQINNKQHRDAMADSIKLP